MNKINRNLSYAEMYFMDLLDEQQKEEYIKYIKEWIKTEQEYFQSQSEYVYSKLKLIYELVLEYNKGRIVKSQSYWLKKLYFIISAVDFHFKEQEGILKLIENRKLYK
jgi:hypothetical protein